MKPLKKGRNVVGEVQQVSTEKAARVFRHNSFKKVQWLASQYGMIAVWSGVHMSVYHTNPETGNRNVVFRHYTKVASKGTIDAACSAIFTYANAWKVKPKNPEFLV